MDALADFLRFDAERTFSYRDDAHCLMRLADWGLRVTGSDAGARWRGKCNSALEAARIVKREGGMVALVDRAFTPLGYRRTTEPQRGDIAIVEAAEGLTAAIVIQGAGEGMVICSMPRLHGMLRFSRSRFAAAWRAP